MFCVTFPQALDTEDGREVAWNSINLRECSTSDRESIAKDLEIIAGLRSPHVVPIFYMWLNQEKEEICYITRKVNFSHNSVRKYYLAYSHMLPCAPQVSKTLRQQIRIIHPAKSRYLLLEDPSDLPRVCSTNIYPHPRL